jgi:hypothetical protein
VELTPSFGPALLRVAVIGFFLLFILVPLYWMVILDQAQQRLPDHPAGVVSGAAHDRSLHRGPVLLSRASRPHQQPDHRLRSHRAIGASRNDDGREIKRLHQEIATTMIYVTHDQIEAMTLADPIVLMNAGHIEQQGAPLDLFERPASLFVAGFLGSPKMNFLQGRLVRQGNGLAVELGEGTPALALPLSRGGNGPGAGTAIILGLRPEHVGRAQGPVPPAGSVRLETVIELVQPTGARSYASFRLAGQPVLCELQAHDVSGPGERISVDLNLPRASLFDPATGKAL